MVIPQKRRLRNFCVDFSGRGFQPRNPSEYGPAHHTRKRSQVCSLFKHWRKESTWYSLRWWLWYVRLYKSAGGGCDSEGIESRHDATFVQCFPKRWPLFYSVKYGLDINQCHVARSVVCDEQLRSSVITTSRPGVCQGRSNNEAWCSRSSLICSLCGWEFWVSERAVRLAVPKVPCDGDSCSAVP